MALQDERQRLPPASSNPLLSHTRSVPAERPRAALRMSPLGLFQCVSDKARFSLLPFAAEDGGRMLFLSAGCRGAVSPRGAAVPRRGPRRRELLWGRRNNFRGFHERVGAGLLLAGAALCLLPHARAVSESLQQKRDLSPSRPCPGQVGQHPGGLLWAPQFSHSLGPQFSSSV